MTDVEVLRDSLGTDDNNNNNDTVTDGDCTEYDTDTDNFVVDDVLKDVDEADIEETRQSAVRKLDELERHGVVLSSYGNCTGRQSLVPATEYDDVRRSPGRFDWRAVTYLCLNPRLIALQQRPLYQLDRTGRSKLFKKGTYSRTGVTAYGPMCSALLRSIVLQREPRLRYVSNGDLIMARMLSRMRTHFKRSRTDNRLAVDATCY